MNIAVIGSGIAGLSTAWMLNRQHRVTLYEADSHLGGHAHTVDVTLDGLTAPVDTGFLVFNHQTYPNLVSLFDHLGVTTAEWSGPEPIWLPCSHNLATCCVGPSGACFATFLGSTAWPVPRPSAIRMNGSR
jgi:uncharacterized protein with NAD-binding domain and iron-sulfur cluster